MDDNIDRLLIRDFSIHNEGAEMPRVCVYEEDETIMTPEEKTQINGIRTQNTNSIDYTAKADNGKMRLSIVPRQIISDISAVREYGIRKYTDPENWKKVELVRYQDALFRHYLAFIDDPFSVDAESGLYHYQHMACNCAFVCEMMHDAIKIVGGDNDDNI